VPGDKSYAPKAQNRGWEATKKNSKFSFFIFYTHRLYFFSIWKALIHAIWICYEKVMDNLVFRATRASS